MAVTGTLAIDLGSSTTVLAFQPSSGGAPELLAIPPFSSSDPCVVPSLIWLENPQSDQPLIGRQVLDAGLAFNGGEGLCRDFKRRIGALAGESGPAAAGAGGEPLTPEQAGSLLITRLWQALPASVLPTRLVLTAPIEGYRGYRQWLQQLSSQIPVEEVALVDEPTAAAIGAGLPAGSRVLVVDLGGGTIDLSLVALQGGEGRAAPIAQLLRFGGRDLDGGRQALRCAEVIGKAGCALGGRDIDRWIAMSLAPDLGEDPSLLEVSERLKCGLSEAEEVTGIWSSAGADSRVLRLDRIQLDRLLRERGCWSCSTTCWSGCWQRRGPKDLTESRSMRCFRWGVPAACQAFATGWRTAVAPSPCATSGLWRRWPSGPSPSRRGCGSKTFWPGECRCAAGISAAGNIAGTPCSSLVRAGPPTSPWNWCSAAAAMSRGAWSWCSVSRLRRNAARWSSSTGFPMCGGALPAKPGLSPGADSRPLCPSNRPGAAASTGCGSVSASTPRGSYCLKAKICSVAPSLPPGCSARCAEKCCRCHRSAAVDDTAAAP